MIRKEDLKEKFELQAKGYKLLRKYFGKGDEESEEFRQAKSKI